MTELVSYGWSEHTADCGCTRCTGFPPGNTYAVSHGATSEARIQPIARNQRRRLLRRLRLSPKDLDTLGLGYLDVYARTAAKVELIDAYVAEHGLIRPDGTLQPSMRVYVSLVNAMTRSLAALEKHLRARERDVDLFELLEVNRG